MELPLCLKHANAPTLSPSCSLLKLIVKAQCLSVASSRANVHKTDACHLSRTITGDSVLYPLTVKHSPSHHHFLLQVSHRRIKQDTTTWYPPLWSSQSLEVSTVQNCLGQVMSHSIGLHITERQSKSSHLESRSSICHQPMTRTLFSMKLKTSSPAYPARQSMLSLNSACGGRPHYPGDWLTVLVALEAAIQ